MVTIMELWLPILLSAVGVFILSSIIHMLLGYHKNDFVGVPDEDGVRAALAPLVIPTGDYVVPHAESMADMKSEAHKGKIAAGPNLWLTVLPTGAPSMGPQLVQWFVYALIVSLLAGYIARLTIPAGADYLLVHRVTSTAAFLGYGLIYVPGSIWYRRKWSTTWKNLFDGLIYGLVTGGVFGWLWPVA